MDELTLLADKAADVLRRAVEDFQNQPPLKDVVMAFVHAVDWKEPWIMGLLALHAVLLVVVLCTRRSTTVQATLFAIMAAAVFNAERLNGIAAKHWKAFATQNYFDDHGVFVCVMLAAPMLFMMFIMLVNYLIEVSKMLIKMKRKELQHKARQRRAAASGNDGGGKKLQ